MTIATMSTYRSECEFPRLTSQLVEGGNVLAEVLAESLSLLDLADLGSVAAEAERLSAEMRRNDCPSWALVYDSVRLAAEHAIALHLTAR